MKKNGLLKSAAVLSLGGILAKGIGALYRIPLSNLLGSYGMGLYQMAYPLFCVLLTFSSAGIPSALARVIARETATGRGSGQTLGTALKLFALLGLCGTALMCLFAPYMSGLQGDGGLLPCYYALAPSVFFVALIAVYRGYFQGKSNMVPTAVSEIAEEAVKSGFGLYFANRFAETPAVAVAYCLLAVTLSELCALVYLMLRSRGEEVRQPLFARRTAPSELLFSALPVMASAALLPLSQAVDSVLLVRLLGRSERAVSLYGLFSGAAVPLVSLPATVCYGLAAASVPAVSGAFARGNAEEGRSRALRSLCFTLAFAAPCAAGLFFFARPAVSLLYGGLGPAETDTLVLLVKALSVSAASLAGVNTLSACLTGMGRAKQAALSMLAAVLAKFALQFVLVPRFSAVGAAIAANVCYLVAFLLDLYYTVKKKRVKKYDHGHRFGNEEGGRIGAGDRRDEKGAEGARAQYVARRSEPV